MQIAASNLYPSACKILKYIGRTQAANTTMMLKLSSSLARVRSGIARNSNSSASHRKCSTNTPSNTTKTRPCMTLTNHIRSKAHSPATTLEASARALASLTCQQAHTSNIEDRRSSQTGTITIARSPALLSPLSNSFSTKGVYTSLVIWAQLVA